HRQQMLDKIERRAAGEEFPMFYETRGIKTNGHEFDMEVHVSTFQLHGEICSLATIRDITERKKAEKQLRDSHRQLRTLMAWLESLREEERIRLARAIHDDLG